MKDGYKGKWDDTISAVGWGILGSAFLLLIGQLLMVVIVWGYILLLYIPCSLEEYEAKLDRDKKLLEEEKKKNEIRMASYRYGRNIKCNTNNNDDKKGE